MSHGTEFLKLLSNAAAGTTGAALPTFGGKFLATCEGTSLDGTHTATIQIQNSNKDWITVYSFAAAGATALDLPPGQYRGVTTASAPTAVYLEMTSIPGD